MVWSINARIFIVFLGVLLFMAFPYYLKAIGVLYVYTFSVSEIILSLLSLWFYYVSLYQSYLFLTITEDKWKVIARKFCDRTGYMIPRDVQIDYMFTILSSSLLAGVFLTIALKA